MSKTSDVTSAVNKGIGITVAMMSMFAGFVPDPWSGFDIALVVSTSVLAGVLVFHMTTMTAFMSMVKEVDNNMDKNNRKAFYRLLNLEHTVLSTLIFKQKKEKEALDEQQNPTQP